MSINIPDSFQPVLLDLPTIMSVIIRTMLAANQMASLPGCLGLLRTPFLRLLPQSMQLLNNSCNVWRSKHNCGHVLHGRKHNKETHLLMLNQPGLLYLLQTLRNACACSCKSEVMDDLQCSIQTTLPQLPSIVQRLFHWMSMERFFSIFI